MPRFLHVGCGAKRKENTVEAFASSAWEEVTLDIDERVRPDIVDRLPELAQVETGSFDAVFSSHNVEHLYPHDVATAFAAFHRVLGPDGLTIVTCPDLQALGERLATGDIESTIYQSQAGPVSPIDMLYGFRPPLRRGNLYMAHHTGFTMESLKNTFGRAGFRSFLGVRLPTKYELWGLATKTAKSEAELRSMAATYLKPIR